MFSKLIEEFNCVFYGLALAEIKGDYLIITIGTRMIEISLLEITAA
jgi:hypothetical protein